MSTLPTLNGPRMAPASGGDPKSVVIFTHGYGSNGEDLIGLAPHWREALPDTVFIAPNAPQGVPGYPGGYQWWPIGGPDRAAGVRAAAPVLDAFIDAELARYGLSEDRLALVGFSQGTMMALHVGPRRERQLAGIVGYSGALVDPNADNIRTRPPILLVHGDADPMVPVAAFYSARDTLVRQGFEVASHVSPGLGHSIDMPGLMLGQQFLSEVLA
jgi:phospholipase/carboxylesterase